MGRKYVLASDSCWEREGVGEDKAADGVTHWRQYPALWSFINVFWGEEVEEILLLSSVCP